jgi:hypothetical protein
MGARKKEKQKCVEKLLKFPCLLLTTSLFDVHARVWALFSGVNWRRLKEILESRYRGKMSRTY